MHYSDRFCDKMAPPCKDVLTEHSILSLTGKKREEGVDELRAAVMFVVIREDAVSFRPNHEACPSFARYLKEASDAGVQIFAQKIRWGQSSEVGKAFMEGPVPVSFPE